MSAAASAPLGWPRVLLAWMLRLTAAFGFLLLVGALWLQLLPEPESSDLPDFRPVAIAALLTVGLASGLFASLGLLALRRPRPALARTFLVLAALLPVVSLLAALTDAREEASASEMNWVVLALPAWCWTICLLASSRSALLAMGLQSAAWGRGMRWGALAAVGTVVGTIVCCNLGRDSPVEEALATLHPGMSWPEVVESAGAICPMSRAEVLRGVMWLRCAPRAPSACAGVPTLARSIELHFVEGKLARWHERWRLQGLERRR